VLFRSIRIIVGFTSGGLYDQYARTLARQMPKLYKSTLHLTVD